MATNVQAQAARPTRAQIVRMRRMEREDGVPFHCHISGFEARVRLLTLSEQAMLAGIPADVQQDLTATLNKQTARPRTRDFSDLLETVADDERLANGFCIAGFVWPRLVATEDDLDGSDDCWLVTDLHIEERLKYLKLILGTEQEEMRRIRSFLHEGLAGAAAD
jgi:hypothetical protein